MVFIIISKMNGEMVSKYQITFAGKAQFDEKRSIRMYVSILKRIATQLPDVR